MTEELDETVGITNSPLAEENNIHIMGNPVGNRLNIQMDRPTEVLVYHIYNSFGKLLMTAKTAPFAGECQINVSRLAAGFYIIKFENSKKVQTIKFEKI